MCQIIYATIFNILGLYTQSLKNIVSWNELFALTICSRLLDH